MSYIFSKVLPLRDENSVEISSSFMRLLRNIRFWNPVVEMLKESITRTLNLVKMIRTLCFVFNTGIEMN